MTTTTEGRPGRPLWLAAERVRLERDWTKAELAEQAGIGRVTYDRLESNSTPPRIRTIKRIADAIGLDYDTAMQMAGLTAEHQPPPAAGGTDRLLLEWAAGGRAEVDQMEEAVRVLRRHLDNLRDVAASTGRTLGEVLVGLRLVTAGELRIPDMREPAHQDAG